jgi:hypothetical protein
LLCFSTEELIHYQKSAPNSIKYCHQTLFFGGWGGRQRLYAQLKANPTSSACSVDGDGGDGYSNTDGGRGGNNDNSGGGGDSDGGWRWTHTTHNNQLKVAVEDVGAAAAIPTQVLQ